MPLSLVAGYHLAHSRLDDPYGGVDEWDERSESTSVPYGSEILSTLAQDQYSPALDQAPLATVVEIKEDEKDGISYPHRDVDDQPEASGAEPAISADSDAMWAMLDEQVQEELDSAMKVAARELSAMVEKQVAANLDSIIVVANAKCCLPHSLGTRTPKSAISKPRLAATRPRGRNNVACSTQSQRGADLDIS